MRVKTPSSGPRGCAAHPGKAAPDHPALISFGRGSRFVNLKAGYNGAGFSVVCGLGTAVT